MDLEIQTYPNPVLSRTAEPVTEIDAIIRSLAAEMAQVMYDNQGIGLAAPQVGHSLRLITVDVSGPEQRTELMTLVNPEIQWREGETEMEEGCLSIPEFKIRIKRAAKVRVQGLDLNGQAQDLEADGLLAVCLQHEIDHLQGKVILDYASRLKRSMYDKKVSKWRKTS